ncbi:hypothetical protein K474DRAFT_1656486 [Panus rudis PR-1116 ss-1]|nr:hypothetical protein K474DRAFT_1656486 [Panus rudis PR-1116 ss-1]
MSTPAPSINNVAPPPVTCDWLEKLMIKHLDIPSSKDFQLKHTLDLIGGKDLFLVAAPSSGKTTILMTVLLCVQARGESGIALLVVPHDFGAEMMVCQIPIFVPYLI